MAFSTNTDYNALKTSLQSQINAETDPTKKAALQAQYDAAEQSRVEKMASDLSKYGKYASDSELDSAAGIMANNQIGTSYDTQKANLNKSYDIAKQNASNDALSRGMARSSFVSDRLSNLDSQRANALSDIDAARATALQNAKATILNNYQTNAKNELASQKSEFANTINAYYPNFQAEIDKVTGNNDPSDDWKIPYLQAARNQKIADQQAAQAKAEQQSFDNEIAYMKATKPTGSSRGSSGSSGTAKAQTISQLDSQIKDMVLSGASNKSISNYISTYGSQYSQQLMDKYGLTSPSQNATPLSDTDASYQVGMHRTAEGQLYAIQSLNESGQITDAQAQALISKFNLSA